MFTGKTVIITGAGSGIGRAAAIKMASLGATVAISDINKPGLDETARLCHQESLQISPTAKHFSSVFDVASPSACLQFITDVTTKISPHLDYILNNAGVNPTVYATEAITDDYWDKITNTNLRGTFNITRACIPYLREGSSLVNVSSICGIKPSAGLAIYCATKYGIVGFTKCLALELGPKGVRVNAVAPGCIRTPSNTYVVNGEEDEAVKDVALGRLGEPDDVVDVITFLFGDGSRFMNGSVVEITGGVD